MRLFPHWTYILDKEKDQVSKRSNHNLGSRNTETDISEALHWLKRNTWHFHTGGGKQLPCPMNCFVCFAILCPKYTLDFQNFRKLEEKRGTEKIIRVAISTVVRYSL